MSDIEDIRHTLTLTRLRGMYLSENKFSLFSEADLWGVLDWLDSTADEIWQMRREAEKEKRGRHEK